MAGAIEVQGLTKSFGAFRAVDDVSFQARAGEITALLGPSGSGKSTVLRMIAGLELPDTGRIWIGDEEHTNKAPQERRLGFVFQHYALFRHMTVRQNVAFGLKVRKAARDDIRSRVGELLELVGRGPLGHRYPDQLAAGASAQAYIRPHDVLLTHTPGDGSFPVVVERRTNLGWLSKLRLRLSDGQAVLAEVPNEELGGIDEGEHAYARLRNAKVFSL